MDARDTGISPANPSLKNRDSKLPLPSRGGYVLVVRDQVEEVFGIFVADIMTSQAFSEVGCERV